MEIDIPKLVEVGGPVVLLIVLGYFERKSILDRHYDLLEKFYAILEKQGEAIKELATIINERLK